VLNVRLLLAFAGHVLFMPPGTKYFLEFEEDSVLLIHKSLTYWNAFDPAHCAITNREGLGKIAQMYKWIDLDLALDREWLDLWRDALNELHSQYMNDTFAWETPGGGGGGHAEKWTLREDYHPVSQSQERRRGSNLRAGMNMMLALETQRQKRKMILDGDPGAKRARMGSYCRGAMGPTGYQLSKWRQRKEVEKWPKPREVQRKSKLGSFIKAILDTNVMEEPPAGVPDTKGPRSPRARKGPRVPQVEAAEVPPGAEEPELQPPPEAEQPQVPPAAVPPPQAPAGRLTRAQARVKGGQKGQAAPEQASAGGAPGGLIPPPGFQYVISPPPLSADLVDVDLSTIRNLTLVHLPEPPAPTKVTQEEVREKREQARMTRRKRQHPLPAGYKRRSLVPPLTEERRREIEEERRELEEQALREGDKDAEELREGDKGAEEEEEEGGVEWFSEDIIDHTLHVDEELMDESEETVDITMEVEGAEKGQGKPPPGRRKGVFMEEDEEEIEEVSALLLIYEVPALACCCSTSV
jgi:hypothetical protein